MHFYHRRNGVIAANKHKLWIFTCCRVVFCLWLSRCATIYSLAFSVDSSFLACSSNTETVHIFRLDAPSSPKEKYALSLFHVVVVVVGSHFAIMGLPVAYWYVDGYHSVSGNSGSL